MDYQIHLYAPKTGKLTPAMIEWLRDHWGSADQPELFWPVKQIRPKALARLLLQLDSTLIPGLLEGGVVELRSPLEMLNLRLQIHDRGVLILFPYMGGMLVQLVLRVCYTYIRYLYEEGGFWSYDPQLNVISYADDYRSIDETAALMDAILPRLLNG
ncbi:MAG: hypothetical protein NZM00_13000 [Anaerolinea sp.]|nr:hypothetical protein [Anaerolinea sp.]